jgi:hypothetical protein
MGDGTMILQVAPIQRKRATSDAVRVGLSAIVRRPILIATKATLFLGQETRAVLTDPDVRKGLAAPEGAASK